MNEKKPVIISTDPGIDDAVAIAIAVTDRNLDVKLIVPTAGNVSLDKTTYNTQKLLTFLDRQIPIVEGSVRPLLRQIKDAKDVHGETGMDGYSFPEPTVFPEKSMSAIEAMHEVVSNSFQKVTIIGIGPLTDIALFTHVYPNDLKNIEEIVLMGGALGRGNFGVLTEFNFGFDPEAARMVFENKIKIRVAPMEVGMQAKLLPEITEKVKKMGKVGEMFYALFKKYRGGSFNTGLKIYDALAIALILNPNIFQIENTHISIETSGELTAGASLFDFKGYLGKEKNVFVATEVDTDKFNTWFLNAIKNTSM